MLENNHLKTQACNQHTVCQHPPDENGFLDISLHGADEKRFTFNSTSPVNLFLFFRLHELEHSFLEFSHQSWAEV